MYTVIIPYKNLKNHGFSVFILNFFRRILYRFSGAYKSPRRQPNDMGEHIPSLADLRSSRYVKRAKDSLSGITHGRIWEQTGTIHERTCRGNCEERCPRNRQHTLRISSSFAEALQSMRGPKGRRSSRVPGSTPDESYVQAGQRASGLPHQLRRRMCLLFSMSNERIRRMLEDNMTYKPAKGKVAVGIVMPDLSEAVEELYRWLIESNPELRFHPALKRRWAPAVCRLMELDWFLQHPE